jgi:predicted RNA binding protein YcfA (HicA-like mRNA interferase family)
MALTGLPLASGTQHKEVFEDLGWTVRSQGNHIVLTHPNRPQVFLSIPNHREVKRQTLKAIVRDAGLTDEQYAAFFDGRNLTATTIEPSPEDLYGVTPLAGGLSRIHCMKCGGEVCISANPVIIEAAKQNHPTTCTGAISAD